MSTKPKDLVRLEFGWYGKFLVPVDAATAMVALLVKSGAVAVDEETINQVTCYLPKQSEFSMTPMKGIFLHDAPHNDAAKKEYKAWLVTKAELVGREYVPELYEVYLQARGETS